MTKTRQWTAFTAVAVLVVFAAGWFLLVKPQKSHAADLRGQALTQQQANQLVVSKIAALQAEEKSLPAQQAALQKFSTEVPDNPSEPTLIRQLSASADGSNVDLVSITPGTATVLSAAAQATAGTTSLSGAPSAAGQLVQLPVALSISGNYANIESFFMSLEKMPRSLLVGSWTLCGSSGGGSSSGSSGCAAATTASGAPAAPDTLTGTLNANVFYAPPSGSTASATTGTITPPTTTSTSPSPAPTTSASSTPAPTTSTAAAS
jgi:Tfp pilus assembly protein PilO